MTEKETRSNTQNLLHSTNSALRNWPIPWIVLLVGLIITTTATLYMKSSVERNTEQEFTSLSKEIQNNITNRLYDHARILQSGAAFFNAAETVTREKWRIFTQHQKVEKTLPGIQGIGFSLLIPRSELTQHIQKIRREGFPQYKMRPEGDRKVYSSIIYLEPFSDRNLRAFGYDMFSESVRRKAMERARDMDTAALSGKVILVQETDKAVQAGTLMYAPVYRKSMPIETVEQRRAAIYGWVYSPYRMNDLMQGIFGNRNLEKEKQLHLQVFDGTQPSIQSLLYDSQSAGEDKLRPDARFTREIPVDFNGQRWTLRFTQTGGGFSTWDYIMVWLTLSGGILITLLLFALIRVLLNTSAEARRIAEKMTGELRASEEKYRVIFNNEIYAICIFDLETLTLLDANDAFSQIYGYSREELISGMTIHDITAEHQVSDAATQQAIREGTIFIPLRYHRKKDGTVFPVEIVGGPYIWNGRKVMFALAHEITERKQAEEFLRESHEQLKDAHRLAHIGIWSWIAETGTVTWSEELYNIAGIDTAKPAPSYVEQSNIYAPESWKLLQEAVDQALTTGKQYQLELQLTRPDGTTRLVNAFGGATYDRNGLNIGLHGTLQDITEQKQAKDALRESEERFRALSEAAFEAIAIHEEGVLINANDQYFKMFGYEPSEAIGKQMMSITIAPEAIELVTKKVATDSLEPYESIGVRKNGTRFPMEILGRKMDYKGRNVRFGAIVDITYRKQVQEELLNSEAQKNAILNGISTNIALVDKELKILWANKAAMNSVNKQGGDIVGHPCYSFWGDKVAPCANCPTLKAFKTGKSEHIIVETPDGRIWDERGEPILDAAGNVTSVVEIAIDITAQKRAEEEKLDLKERLTRSEKMESLGLLAGGVAHDLNNVLGIVVGYAEMVLDAIDEKSPLKKDLTTIFDGGQRAAAIVDDLLTLARRGVVGKKVLNLNKLIGDFKKSPQWSKLLTYHPSVKMQIDLEQDLLNIAASSVHLEKTLYNLVSNASEAMTEGGNITIKTNNRYIDKPISGYDTILEGDYVVLSVSDEGDGISETDLKRVFEPFYTKKIMGRSGTGLGLSVVWGTVKDHKGYIDVQSEEGKGTTFTLYFLVTREDIEEEGLTVSMSEYLGNGQSLLLVDDVEDQRDLAARLLTSLNYKVSSVESGEEAIEYLKENKVDLLVLDMIMDPGMDGLDTYKSILEINPKQKAIIVSGFSESDRVKEAKTLGAGAYIKKPYIKEKLGLAVKKELARK